MTLPTKIDERYKKQAEHNKKLLTEKCFLDPCRVATIPYLDWNITIAFYVALHFLQCYLSRNGFKTVFSNHTDRNNYLKNSVSIRDYKVNKILADYLALYKLSRRYRYTPCQFYYPNSRLACTYAKFALRDLPTTLGII